MPPDDRPRDREPESGAAGIPAASRVGAVERLEDARQVFGRDADASVDHFEHGRLPIGAERHPNRTLVHVVLDRIGEDVTDGLEQAVRIADDDWSAAPSASR